MFDHTPHPHVAARTQPRKVHEHHGSGWLDRFGLRITLLVGTMTCALVFGGLALISLPSAIRSGDPIVIVSWVAQTFLQLVLLSIILLGQGIQSKAADERADATFKDAEAILHEALELQRHLHAQDAVLASLIARERTSTGSLSASGTTPLPTL